MGGHVYTDHDYDRAVEKHVAGASSVTERAEQKALSTGKLNPQVDPAMDGVIRRSKPRYNRNEELNLWELAVGVPMPIETRLDTTGSMGDNVDRAMKVLPQLYKLCNSVLPGLELQLATGIFGDIQDQFVLCRPKFADSADRLVERLTLMVPERDGGDVDEDPHYGLFGAAYLTDAKINRYGLKYYDFTVSDAAARDRLIEEQLVRIFGPDVFAKVAENGYKIDKSDLPSTKEIVQELSKRAHAFFIQINNNSWTTSFWKDAFGEDHCVFLSDINYLPHVQAVIVGLTEGTITISNATSFLTENGVDSLTAEKIVRSVAHIPVGVQAILRSRLERLLPQKGEFFLEKTDLWPVERDKIVLPKKTLVEEAKINWL